MGPRDQANKYDLKSYLPGRCHRLVVLCIKVGTVNLRGQNGRGSIIPEHPSASPEHEQIKELPAVRRTQPITKKADISSTTHVHCYNGYMVYNNNRQYQTGIFSFSQTLLLW